MHTSGDPVVIYLAVRRMMTVDWSAPRCVASFRYSCNNGVAHPLEEYRAIIRNHGKPAERLLSAVAIAGIRSFVHIEYAPCNLLIYCGSTFERSFLVRLARRSPET